jgi:hypothetical protein
MKPSYKHNTVVSSINPMYNINGTMMCSSDHERKGAIPLNRKKMPGLKRSRFNGLEYDETSDRLKGFKSPCGSCGRQPIERSMASAFCTYPCLSKDDSLAMEGFRSSMNQPIALSDTKGREHEQRRLPSVKVILPNRRGRSTL